MTYECAPSLWDNRATFEKTGDPSLLARYCQHQCLVAFQKGMKYLDKKQNIRMLKTDLWTEGVRREREVLNHALRWARNQHYFVKAVGMDISGVACQKAGTYTRAQLVQADIRSLPYADESFDMILDVSTIDHIPLEEAAAVIQDYWICLKEHGVLVLIFAHQKGTLDNKDMGDEYYCFPIRDMKMHLGHCGFAIKEEYAIHSLNTRPMAYLMSSKLKLAQLDHISKGMAQFIEYSPVSKHLLRIAPLYVVIARK